MKNERELFEEVFKTLSHTFNESLYMIPNTDRYYSSIAQASWEAWQASAKREGYKIVPVEPSEDMIMAGCMEHGGYDVIDSKSIYKAMIGAIE